MRVTHTPALPDPGAMNAGERVLWRAGWHPLGTAFAGGLAGLAVGNAAAVPAALLWGVGAFATMSTSTAAGLAAGLAGWLLGVRLVNARHEGVDPGCDGEADYALVAGAGDAPLLSSPRRHSVTAVTLGPDAVRFDQRGFDWEARTHVGDGREVEVSVDDLLDVTAEAGALVVETRADRFRFACESRPDNVAAAIRDRAGVADRGAGA